MKELQTVAERKKKKNEAEISPQAFPLESPSKKGFWREINTFSP